jgi:hypothetical protein
MANTPGPLPAPRPRARKPLDELRGEQERIRAVSLQQRRRAAAMRQLAVELRAESRRLLPPWQ